MFNTSKNPSAMMGLCIDFVSVRIDTPVNLEVISTALPGLEIKYDSGGRFTAASGSFENLSVRIGLDTVRIAGSPARYLHTANVFPVGPPELAVFASRIADDLHLPLENVMNAVTGKLDVALNVITKHPPRSYFPLLLDMPRTSRMEAESTLYFTNSTRKARIYDKIAEVRKKRLIKHISAEQAGVNLLRIEFSTSAVKRDFKMPVTLAKLADPSFWPEVRAFWIQHYSSIMQDSKNAISGRAGIVPSTASDLRDYYAALGVEATGGKQEAMALVRANQTAGSVKPDQASRMRKMIEELNSSSSVIHLNQLSSELSSAVNATLESDEARILSMRAGISH